MILLIKLKYHLCFPFKSDSQNPFSYSVGNEYRPKSTSPSNTN